MHGVHYINLVLLLVHVLSVVFFFFFFFSVFPEVVCQSVLFMVVAAWLPNKLFIIQSSHLEAVEGGGWESIVDLDVVLTHHPDELVKVYSAVPVGVGLLEHVVALLPSEGVAVLGHGRPQLLAGDRAVAVVVEGSGTRVQKSRKGELK